MYPVIWVGKLRHGELNLVKLWQQVYRKKDLKTLCPRHKGILEQQKTGWVILLGHLRCLKE